MRYLMQLLILAAGATTALADEGTFTKGPVFTDYGPVADVDVTMSVPAGTAKPSKKWLTNYRPAPG